MKKVAVTFLLSLFLVSALCLNFQAQNEPVIHVTFILTSPNLPDGTSVYITQEVLSSSVRGIPAK